MDRMLQSAAMTLENTFSWSASRSRLFRDCPRAYYYSYYGAWGGWDRAAEAGARHLYYLKNLTTLPLWVGKQVHDAVERLLREVRAGRRADPATEAEAMVQRMRSDYRDSMTDRAREDPKGAARFFEHHYGADPPPARWVAARDDAVSCLETFGRLPFLDNLERLGPEAFLALENLEQWDFDGTPVYVRLDLAYRDGEGRIHLVDWKTGRRKNPPDPLQMLGYAAYATEAWKVTPSDLEVREVYLRFADDPDNPCPVSERTLEEGRTRITASIGDMKALLEDPEANLAREGDFPLTDQPRTCRYCFFREVCPQPAA